MATKPTRSLQRSQSETVRRPPSELVSLLVPLHRLIQLQTLSSATFRDTAESIGRQTVVHFTDPRKQKPDDGDGKSLGDKAEKDIQKAFDALDKSDPLKPDFGKGADFPAICFTEWKDEMRNIIQLVADREKELEQEGDKNAHEDAVNAFETQFKVASENLLRCLNQPPKLKDAASTP